MVVVLSSRRGSFWVWLGLAVVTATLSCFSSSAPVMLSGKFIVNKDISEMARSLGDTPSHFHYLHQPEFTDMQSMTDGTVKFMYNHCTPHSSSSSNSSTTTTTTTTTTDTSSSEIKNVLHPIQCEIRIAHIDPTSEKHVSPEIVLTERRPTTTGWRREQGGPGDHEQQLLPGLRGLAMYAHKDRDGIDKGKIVLTVWTTTCANEPVCECTAKDHKESSKICSISYDSDKYDGYACQPENKWSGVPGGRYCSNPNRLNKNLHPKRFQNYYQGQGWDCKTNSSNDNDNSNTGLLVSPINGGVKIGRVYILKIDTNGSIEWETLGHDFTYDFSEDYSTIQAARRRAITTTFKSGRKISKEQEYFEYAIVHPMSATHICDLHWGCVGYIIDGRNGRRVERPLPLPVDGISGYHYRGNHDNIQQQTHICSHCAGMSVGFHPQSRKWAISCSSDSYPGVGVFINGQYVTGEGDLETTNTGDDNTHRQTSPVIIPVNWTKTIQIENKFYPESPNGAMPKKTLTEFQQGFWMLVYRDIEGPLSTDPASIKLLLINSRGVVENFETLVESIKEGKTLMEKYPHNYNLGSDIHFVQFHHSGKETTTTTTNSGTFLLGFSRGDRRYIQHFLVWYVSAQTKMGEPRTKLHVRPLNGPLDVTWTVRWRGLNDWRKFPDGTIGWALPWSEGKVPPGMSLDLSRITSQKWWSPPPAKNEELNKQVHLVKVKPFLIDYMPEYLHTYGAKFCHGFWSYPYHDNTSIELVPSSLDFDIGPERARLPTLEDEKDIMERISFGPSGGWWCTADCKFSREYVTGQEELILRTFSTSRSSNILNTDKEKLCPIENGETWVAPCFGGQCQNAARPFYPSSRSAMFLVSVYDKLDHLDPSVLFDNDLETFIVSGNMSTVGEPSHFTLHLERKNMVIQNIVIVRAPEWHHNFPIRIKLITKKGKIKTVGKQVEFDEPIVGGILLGENWDSFSFSRSSRFQMVSGYFWPDLQDVQDVVSIKIEAMGKGISDILKISEIIVSGYSKDNVTLHQDTRVTQIPARADEFTVL